MSSGKYQYVHNDGQIGTRAISSFQYETLTATSQRKRTRQKIVQKEILFPLFATGIEFIKDQFWADKLKEAAEGKLPRYFSYKSDCLYFSKGSSKANINIPSNPVEAAYVFVDFIRKHGYIFSPSDNQRYVETDVEREIEITWKEVSSTTKERLIVNYATYMSKRMNLTSEEKKQLYQIIKLGVYNKTFTFKEIKLIEKQIQSVTGLYWDKNRRRFVTDCKRVVNSKCVEDKVELSNTMIPPKFSTYWGKYIKIFEKKMDQIKRFHRISEKIDDPNIDIVIIEMETDTYTDTESKNDSF